MNDTEIEKVLRKAPRVKVPAHLREKIEADIVLPRAEVNRMERNDWRPLFKRWLPALSFGALLLGCLVAIGVQSNVLLDLRRENQKLRAASQDLEQLREENTEYQRLQAENRQLEQLRKDNAELEQLRAEIAQLRVQAQELAQLRAENKRLVAQQKAFAAGAQEEDPFGMAKEKANSVTCISNLKQIGLGARMWANDNHDILPRDFLTMSNELNSPKILVCPSDERRNRVTEWSQFTPAKSSYELLAPGLKEGPPWNTIMSRCPIHGHVGLIDGSVQGGAWKWATQKDGRWLLERRN